VKSAVANADHHFASTVSEHYDRHLGPVIFEPYAADLTRRVTLQTDGPVLETACGTGILTRRLRAYLPEGIPLMATDLSEKMLAYARENTERSMA